MAVLVLKNGENAGQSFEILGQEQTIGRGLQNDIRIDERSISRKHAVILRRPDGTYAIRDNNATYGTFLNGQRIQEAELPDHAEVRLGGAILEFIIQNAGRAPLPEPLVETSPKTDTNVTVLFSMGPEGKAEEDSDTALRSARQRLQIALDVSALLSTARDLGNLFDRILTETFKVIKARNAGILLWDAENKTFDLAAGRDNAGSAEPVSFSRSIVRRVIEKEESLLISDTGMDASLETAQSVFTLGIKSAMCVPLRHRDEILGALFVDAPGLNAFSNEDLRLLQILGNIAGTAIVTSRLQAENVRAARLAAIGESMAGLAHDIKNIMAGIKGGSFMVDEGINGENRDMLTMGWDLLKVSQDRITQLVWNMLDYSKERKPQFEEVDLEETLKNVRDLVAARGSEKGAEVFLEIHPDAKTVRAEGLSIHRCILNLSGNALDALPDDKKGKITIRTRPDEGTERIAIDVEDNGVGIPEDVLPRLFKAFQSTKGSKGTGLGLAVSRKIAREHEGDISVASKLGVGTTFTVHLPRTHAQKDEQ